MSREAKKSVETLTGLENGLFDVDLNDDVKNFTVGPIVLTNFV